MAKNAGIVTKKDNMGNITHITVNVKKHPKAVEALRVAGVIEKSELRKKVEANRSFYSPVDKVFDRLIEKIESWPWQK